MKLQPHHKQFNGIDICEGQVKRIKTFIVYVDLKFKLFKTTTKVNEEVETDRGEEREGANASKFYRNDKLRA